MSIFRIDLNRYTALISDGRLSEAIALLREALPPLSDTADPIAVSVHGSLESAESAYRAMLHYFVGGNPDPDRSRMIAQFKSSLLKLGLLTLDRYRKSRGTTHESALMRALPPDGSVASLLAALPGHTDAANRFPGLDALTQYLHLTLDLTADDLDSLRRLHAPSTTSDVRCAAISGLILRLTRRFDEDALGLLFSFYESARSTDDAESAARAMVGLACTLHRHAAFLPISAALTERLSWWTDDDTFRRDLIRALREVSRQQQTPRLQATIESFFVPRLKAISEHISSTSPGMPPVLDPDTLRSSGHPELYDALERYLRLQSSGADVCISMFGRLKQYPFFHTPSHWLQPFDAAHPAIAETHPDPQFLQLISGLDALCASDKYSFAFSLHALGESERSQYLHMLSGSLPDSSADLPVDARARERAIVNFVHDLYRYDTLFAAPHGMRTVMESSTRFEVSDLARRLSLPVETWRRFADDSLTLGNDTRYVELTDYMLDHGYKADAAFFLRKAQAHTRLAQPEAALRYLSRADLLDPDNPDILFPLADAFWHTRHDRTSALRCYDRLEGLVAPDSRTRVLLGKSHVLLHDFAWEDALALLFKALYIDESDVAVLRLLAWTLLLLDRSAEAEKYFSRLPSDADTLLGRLLSLWAQSRHAEAVPLLRDLRETPDWTDALSARADLLQHRHFTPETLALLSDSILTA